MTPDQHKNSPTTSRQEPSSHPALATQLDPDREQPFNCMNYCDDFSGCESSLHRAEAAFLALGNLLTELGLKESVEKACPPATSMVFLGIQFNSNEMIMSVPADKLQEVRGDLEVWSRKTTAVRRDLQSILGKLFWISKCVRHSRAFMGRLLQQLRDIKDLPDT